MQKRKALSDEAADMKSKKQKLETDVVALTASADELAEKAREGTPAYIDSQVQCYGKGS
jgi:predicted  nucleic acid-binding Zn-ribbon protein